MSTTTTVPRLVQLLSPDRPLRPEITRFLNLTAGDALANIEEMVRETRQRLERVALKTILDTSELAPLDILLRFELIPMANVRRHERLFGATDPAEAGVECCAGQENVMVTPELLAPLRRDDEAYPIQELDLAVSSWRRVVCAVWASQIISQLARIVANTPANLSTWIASRPTMLFRAGDPNEPLGRYLELPDLSDDEFHGLRARWANANFALKRNEIDLITGLRALCGNISLGQYIANGQRRLADEDWLEAHRERSARFDFALGWSTVHRAYQLDGQIKQVDAQGTCYVEETVSVPSLVVALLRDRCNPNDLIPLGLRAFWLKAQALLEDCLVPSLD